MTPAEVHLLADEIWDIGKRYEQEPKRDVDVMTILKHAATKLYELASRRERTGTGPRS